MASVLHAYSFRMWRKNTFLPIFSCLLAGLAWWSSYQGHSIAEVQPFSAEDQLVYRDPSSEGNETEESTLEKQRLDLLEALDHLAREEHAYHDRKGRYSYVLLHKALPTLGSLAPYYEVRITEASEDRFIVSAFSEDNGRMKDAVTVDQNFNVRANFPIPMPRFEYLGKQVLRNLLRYKDFPSQLLISEQTLFKGFFKYGVKTDPKVGKSVVAVGQLPPVEGLKLVLDQDKLSTGEARLQNSTFRSNQKWQNILNPVVLSRKLEGAVSGRQKVITPAASNAVRKLIIEEIPEVKRLSK